MNLTMRYYGDPVLRKKAKPVKEVTAEIRQLGQDLIDTMYTEDGIGLAAPQVGVSLRMLAIDAGDKRGHPQVWINPFIELTEGETLMEEGCLSFPGIYGKITRPAQARIQGQNLEGETLEMELEGLECRAILHEMDHLDGVLFIDRMSPSHKIVIQPKLKKLLKQTRKSLAE